MNFEIQKHISPITVTSFSICLRYLTTIHVNTIHVQPIPNGPQEHDLKERSHIRQRYLFVSWHIYFILGMCSVWVLSSNCFELIPKSILDSLVLYGALIIPFIKYIASFYKQAMDSRVLWLSSCVHETTTQTRSSSVRPASISWRHAS